MKEKYRHAFLANLQRGTTFVTAFFFTGRHRNIEMESTHKGENLLLLEQILSFKSRSRLKKAATMKNRRVASLESLPSHLKCTPLQIRAL